MLDRQCISYNHQNFLPISLCRKFHSLPMSFTKESNVSFSWFENPNFTGWLVQLKAHLRKHGASVVFEQPLPSDIDAQGYPFHMKVPQTHVFNDDLVDYNRLNNIVFSDLLKACRQNPIVTNISETGEFNTSLALLMRLQQCYYTVDDITKAAHMLQYHALKQKESKVLNLWIEKIAST